MSFTNLAQLCRSVVYRISNSGDNCDCAENKTKIIRKRIQLYNGHLPDKYWPAFPRVPDPTIYLGKYPLSTHTHITPESLVTIKEHSGAHTGEKDNSQRQLDIHKLDEFAFDAFDLRHLLLVLPVPARSQQPRAGVIR